MAKLKQVATPKKYMFDMWVKISMFSKLTNADCKRLINAGRQAGRSKSPVIVNLGHTSYKCVSANEIVEL